ncbi:uncharacterized protein LOC110990932, partial [Acanthaster planci]|uniref:Uncharacterized protein LOC110990932 n=1 Tax=Acanthaster planci TaxID=133434 RepID=A0A8B8A450_ACAPL
MAFLARPADPFSPGERRPARQALPRGFGKAAHRPRLALPESPGWSGRPLRNRGERRPVHWADGRHSSSRPRARGRRGSAARAREGEGSAACGIPAEAECRARAERRRTPAQRPGSRGAAEQSGGPEVAGPGPKGYLVDPARSASEGGQVGRQGRPREKKVRPGPASGDRVQPAPWQISEWTAVEGAGAQRREREKRARAVGPRRGAPFLVAAEAPGGPQEARQRDRDEAYSKPIDL